MSALSDYLMTHHLSAMGNETNKTIEATALEVIKAQDAALEEAKYIIHFGWVFFEGEELNDRATKWMYANPVHPTPPAQSGGK